MRCLVHLHPPLEQTGLKSSWHVLGKQTSKHQLFHMMSADLKRCLTLNSLDENW